LIRAHGADGATPMPVVRYFFYVGGVLLALLFISDAFLPKLPVAESVNGDLPMIRIHSDRKWPERVVFDTSLPTIAPAQLANTQSGIQVPTTVADVSPKVRVREAFAQLRPSDVAQAQAPDAKKPEAKPPRKRKIAKRRAAPPVMLVAQQPRFGFFDWNSTW
jgi:hypothetical protein